MALRLFPALALVILIPFASGCGSDDDDSDARTADEPATTAVRSESTDAGSATTAALATEPPATVAGTVASEVNILTDFGDVCRGVKLPGATDYDPNRSGIHPLITMAGEDPEYEAAGANLPDQWDPVIGEEQTVELVACLARTSTTLSQTCEGYQDDSNEAIDKTVELYDVSYDVRLIAATTGEVVASTQLDASDEECPMFVLFDEGSDVTEWYAEPTEALTAWLAPYVET